MDTSREPVRFRPEHILVVNPFGIGDVLFSTPVLAALRRAFGTARIDYLCNAQSAPVLQENPDVHRMFFYSRGDFKKIRRRSRGRYVAALGAALWNLMRQRFDLVVDLSLVSQYSAVFRLLGVGRRVGFDYRNRGRFLTQRLALPEGFRQRHVISFYRELLEQTLGIGALMPERPRVFIPEAERKWAGQLLSGMGADSGDLLVGMLPFGGASWGLQAHQKRWPITGYARVAAELSRIPGVKILLCGTPEDRTEARELFHCSDPEVPWIDLCGKTTLRQLLSVLSQCRLCIGGDSGPMHCAAALDVPIVSLQGPADERVYGPVGDPARIRMVAAELSCRPCYRAFTQSDCIHPLCQTELKPETVIEAARELLRTYGDRTDVSESAGRPTSGPDR